MAASLVRRARAHLAAIGLVAAISIVVAASAAAGASTPPMLTGSINLVNKQWVCSGPVNLDSVTVTMNADATGPLQGAGNTDAVHIHSGCTGRIGKLTVVQYLGDGIKVGQGAHDIVVEGGSVRCYGHAPGKHQDGVQVMGGSNILFKQLDVQCQTANNAAFFLNQGTNSSQAPSGVICDACVLSGGGITVRIYHSVGSGVRNSVIVAGHLSPLRIDKVSAVNPVDVNNTILPTGSTPTAPPAPTAPAPAGPAAASPTVVERSSPAGGVLRPRLLGAVALVKARIAVDQAATLAVSAFGPAGVALPLLRGSLFGPVVIGQTHRTIVSRSVAGRSLTVTLRLPAASVVRGRTYRLRIVATTPAGKHGSLMLRFAR